MRPPPPPPPPRPLYVHEVPSTSTEFCFLSTSDLRGPPSGGQEERTERWNSPAEKEARRERKTGSAPKVSEKGGWIVDRESVRKKDGRAGHRDGRHTVGRGGGGDEGDMPKRRGVRGGWLQAPAWSSSFSSTLSSSSSSLSSSFSSSSFFFLSSSLLYPWQAGRQASPFFSPFSNYR